MPSLNSLMTRILSALLLSTVGLSATATAEVPAERPLALLAADPGLQWGPCPPFFSEACRM